MGRRKKTAAVQPRPKDPGEITGPYRGLAEVVRALALDTRGNLPSSRVVARRIGVSFSTVLVMTKGERPAEISLIRFARAYSINPNRLLVLAGHEEMPEFDLRRWEGETSELKARFGWEDRAIPDVPLAAGLPGTETDQQTRLRILTQIQIADADGTFRPLTADELTPERFALLREELLSALDGSGAVDEPELAPTRGVPQTPC